MQVQGERWLLVKVREHLNTCIEASSCVTFQQAKVAQLISLAERSYIEKQHTYSTWVEDATSKLVYARSIDEHIALERKRQVVGGYTLVGLGKYALMHYSDFRVWP